MALFAGLMSGTSLDGVDAVMVDFAAPGRPAVLAHVHLSFDPLLRAALLDLNSESSNEIHKAELAGNAVSRRYAEAIDRLLKKAGRDAREIRSVGAHGQTVRHRPGEFDGTGYTVQLLNAALLAELSKIDVICDFRSRDVAAGGQGAPLVPAVHEALFARAGQAVAVLNLGGMSNLTLLPSKLDCDAQPLGFDCGPGNVLLDGWCERHTGKPFDNGGSWAASGQVVEALLERLLAEPYFHRRPPKSTGRDLFDMRWLDSCLDSMPSALSPPDVQATLAELTVRAVVYDLKIHGPATKHLLVCGGGALNAHLMQRLESLEPAIAVTSTATYGLPVDQVEAFAFAWLAHAFCNRTTANLPSATGASGPRVLGALYPAG